MFEHPQNSSFSLKRISPADTETALLDEVGGGVGSLLHGLLRAKGLPGAVAATQ